MKVWVVKEFESGSPNFWIDSIWGVEDKAQERAIEIQKHRENDYAGQVEEMNVQYNKQEKAHG